MSTTEATRFKYKYGRHTIAPRVDDMLNTINTFLTELRNLSSN